MSVPTRAFVATINHLLAPAPWARDRLAPHADRCAMFSATPFEFLFRVLPDGFLEPAESECAPDVILSLPLSAVPRLAAGGSTRAMSAVRIEGNAELADALGFVFRHLRWDAEEDLSRVTGDILARRIVLGAEAAKSAHARAWNALGGNLTEYFTEEQEILVTRPALDAYRDDLARLRDDVARLEKRIGRFDPRTSARQPRATLPPSRRGASSA
ncbi:ubiquinone biosynthesis accessory factor UbiJ [Aromatoleum sp.]|uniref:ubiquinone biosynthesis accessory factor UbiJ n=1 Tax=Aromatoleum sp. TaxID=2307007 RepID=UPI002FCC47AC